MSSMNDNGAMSVERYSGRHQIVAAMLLRADAILLCHRSRDRAWYPDVWDLPGGHIEAEESPGDALVREIQEELGVTLSGPLGEHSFSRRPWSSRCESGLPMDGPALRRTVHRRSTMRSAGSPNERYVPCAWQTTHIAVGSPKPCHPNDQRMHRGRLQATHRPIKNRFGTSPVAAAIYPDSR